MNFIAEKDHAGKYMVRAENAGGEAQSIADFAVFEPTPDTMVEMHKTLVYENLADKNAKKVSNCVNYINYYGFTLLIFINSGFYK